MPIPLHQPFFDEREAAAAAAVVRSGSVGGNGPRLRQAEAWMRERFGVKHALCVTSGTHALEMALMVHDVGPGAEVIVPAYTHASSAGCAVRQGARVVFADVLPETPHLDPEDVARKITPRTRAIVVVHYGGIPADMDALLPLARKHGLAVVEDAAHAFDSRHRDVPCGALGQVGCFSFQYTKNLTCGEGGAFLTNDDALAHQAEIIREMGTDRARMTRGEVDRYTWRGEGSSFIPSEVLMAVLCVQLEKADEILERRRRLFHRYMTAFAELERAGAFRLPVVPEWAFTNGHVLHLMLPDLATRDRYLARFEAEGIGATIHFVALDTSPFGRRFLPPGSEGNPHSQAMTSRLIRLPLWAALTDAGQDRVIATVRAAAAAQQPVRRSASRSG